MAYQSADGVKWAKVREQPVLTEGAFDSQNLAFWSESEKRYVCYYRTLKKIGTTGYRWISRAVSNDFLNWENKGEMTCGDAPPEHLYTNQTSAYFRAPHIYIAICARFMPGRQVLSDAEAKAVNVDPGYFNSRTAPTRCRCRLAGARGTSERSSMLSCGLVWGSTTGCRVRIIRR